MTPQAKQGLAFAYMIVGILIGLLAAGVSSSISTAVFAGLLWPLVGVMLVIAG
jgi:hypothetical protein